MRPTALVFFYKRCWKGICNKCCRFKDLKCWKKTAQQNMCERGKKKKLAWWHAMWQEAGRYTAVGFIYSLFAQQHSIIYLAGQVGNNVFDGIWAPAPWCVCECVCVYVPPLLLKHTSLQFSVYIRTHSVNDVKHFKSCQYHPIVESEPVFFLFIFLMCSCRPGKAGLSFYTRR